MPKRKQQQLDLTELKRPTVKRAKEIDADLPYDKLQDLLDEQDVKSQAHTVAHWFRSKDLRTQDNIALHNASAFAKDQSTGLVTFYINCPAEFEWHGTSPARTDFIFENLKIMQKELKELNIPLVVLDAPKRKDIVPTALKFIEEHDVSHLYANYEYEVDEIRRDTKLLEELESKACVSLHHDQTIVEPGTMTSGSGGPMKVFTPYHKMWLAVVKDDPSLLDTVPSPSKVDSKHSKHFSSLFDSIIPSPPSSKSFATKDEESRIRKLWPAGHKAAVDRLNHFIKKNLEDYGETRSDPSKDTTSRLSAYFSAGVISMRETLTAIKKYNEGSADFSPSGTSTGATAWVRELVFRELYRQTTLTTPHTAMNLPQNLKFDFVKWEDDSEGWRKWCEGKTGMPLVDAGMRQLNHEAWMHNRARMNVSSYLYCNLLLDYRRGERYFAEHLIDWDLSNNTQGWEPSYTVFNPVSQAERNDPSGEYIRKWVPELKNLKGKDVFDPFHRLGKKEFEKLGYPAPHVDWAETKQRCLERYKRDMGGVTL